MRVICDQCAATYNVPNAKLTRPITTASCKSCGAQLRIPKPRPGMSEDEQVVVQAIPATGGLSKGDIVRPGFEEDDDKTMPVVDARARGVDVDDEVPLLAGAPLSADEKAALRSAGSLGGSGAVAAEPKPAPPPVVRRGGVAAPAAAPAANAGPDAGGGLVIAFVGVVLAAVGVVLLGMVDTAVVRVPGLFLGLAGTLTAMFVLAFGGFGKANGRGVLSAGLGVMFALLMSPAIALLHGDFALPRISFASAPSDPVPAAPAPADDPSLAAAGDDDDDDDDDAVAEAKPRKSTTRTEPKKTTTAAKPASTTSTAATSTAPASTGGRSEPVSAPRDEPPRRDTTMAARDDYDPPPTAVRPSAPPPPPPADPGPSVPAPVLDMIIKNNVGVKKCFYESMKADEVSRGAVVRTTFQLSASGSASNLRVNNPELRGGRLERCLDGAFAGMSFPSSASGGPVNYAFNL